jgi:hypothetical protein
MSDELKKLEQDRDYWKRVASYLASVHAATLSYDGTLKSCSAARRHRYEEIVTKAADMMDGRDWRMGLSYARATPEEALKDCQEALAYVKTQVKS